MSSIFGDRFAEIRDAFAGKHFAIARAAGGLFALGKIDRRLTEKTESDEARPGVFINAGLLVDADIDARFVLWFLRRRRARIAGVQRGGGSLGAGGVFLRNRRIQFLDLPDLAASQQNRRAEFNPGRVIEINFVGHERPEKTGRAEQDEDPGQDRDRRQDEQPGQDFISLQLHLCFLPESALRCCRSRTERPRGSRIV